MSELIPILQEKLSLEAEEVTAQLQSYVEFARARAAESTGMEVQDLGTFRLRGDVLTFEPEERLQSAINYKYRPLPTLSIVDGVVQPSKIAPGVEDQTTVTEARTEKPELETATASDTDVADDATEEPATESVAETATSESSASAPELPRERPSKARHVSEVNESKALSSHEQRRFSAPLLGTLGFLLVAVAISTFVFLSRSDTNTAATHDLSEVTKTAERPPDELVRENPEEISDQDPEITGGQIQNEEKGEIPASTPPAGTPVAAFSTALSTTPSGLETLPADGRVYSVIIGSTSTEAQAAVHVNRFPETGYPVTVIPYERSGVEGFRIGVGLFTTVASADSARQSLVGVLPEGSWIIRIQ